MNKFTERLRLVMKSAGLTVADVARLFDRERRTVSCWVHEGRQPTGARAEDAFDRLAKLEKDLRQRQGFPVPLRLSKRNRVQYIRLVGEGKLEDARVLAEDLAS